MAMGIDLSKDTPPLSWGIPPTPDLAERVQEICAPVSVDGLLAGTPSVTEAIALWHATRAHQGNRDHLAWCVVLDAIRRAFEGSGGALSSALRPFKHHAGRTRAEVNLQLGSRFYYLAWKLGAEADASVQTRFFELAIEAFDRAENERARLPTKSVRGLTGMRGVAAVAIGRRKDLATSSLERAICDLEKAERLGDESAAHFAFVIEAHLGLSRMREGDDLVAAEAAVERSFRVNRPTRELLISRATVAGRRGMAQSEGGDVEGARRSFARAVEILTTAVGTDEAGQRTPEEFLRARRGQWRFQLALLHGDLDVRKQLLDDAIDDLRRGRLRSNALPRALVARAEIDKQNDNWSAVAQDMADAASYLDEGEVGDQPLRDHVEKMKATAETWVGVDSKLRATTLGGVRAALEAPDPTTISLAAVAHGIRSVANSLSRTELAELALKAAKVARHQLDDDRLDDAARRFAGSHGANLLWNVARLRDDLDVHKDAYRLFRDAVEAGTRPAPRELLSNAGTCALRLARRLVGGSDSDREEALALLEDAHAHLEGALAQTATDNPQLGTTLLILGDVLARRYTITHDPNDATAAIGALERAKAHDAEPDRVDEILGLLYYRRGKVTGSPDDLEKALALKEAAGSGSEGPSRENLSVRAAAELALYESRADPVHLERATDSLIRTIDIDPTWPWPYLQLGFVARANPRTVDAASPASSLRDIALSGDDNKLFALGAERAVSQVEFVQHDLGGRQHAYVVADPHNLLAQALVLKPTDAESARREWKRADDLRDFVARHGDPLMKLPTPVAIVEGQRGKPVYVMRRAKGRQLGRLAVDAGPQDVVQELYLRAAKLLALFHAHDLSTRSRPKLWASAQRRNLAWTFGGILRQFGAAEEAIATARQAFREAIALQVPLVGKKDAHPDNWLATEEGAVVMLDLEATTQLPILLEVAQLIEDYPLLPPSEEGMTERLAMVNAYLDTLRRLGFHLELPTSTRTIYETFAVWEAVDGLRFVYGKRREVTSSAAAGHASRRIDHFRELITWLSDNGEHETVRRAASTTRAALAGTVAWVQPIGETPSCWTS